MSTMSAEARAEYLKRYMDQPKKRKTKKEVSSSANNFVREPLNSKRDSDKSPSRRHKHSSKSDSDASPPRQRPYNGDSDASPPRQRLYNGDSDASPPRRRPYNGDSDASPPRQQSSRRRVEDDVKAKRSKREPSSSPSHSRRESSYRQDKPVERERQKVTNEPEEANEGDGFAIPHKRVTLFNRGALYGKKPEDPERKARESAKQKEWESKYEKWSKGLQQTKERESKLQEMNEVAQESFTRYADDEKMNAHLKEHIYDELDPMANYYRTKQQKIEMKTGTVYPKYKGHWPPNRFGIPPGYRWDGVDRSNGFEAKIANAQNKRKALDEMAYRSIAECEE